MIGQLGLRVNLIAYPVVSVKKVVCLPIYDWCQLFCLPIASVAALPVPVAVAFPMTCAACHVKQVFGW